ncbi:MAG: hypothetical protein IPI44_23700 [Sulfuritalea sp.]|nr:hypothetical protein [Sulfuritalea sp.]
MQTISGFVAVAAWSSMPPWYLFSSRADAMMQASPGSKTSMAPDGYADIPEERR